MHNPELLAPAGTLDHLKTALAYGADAVYAGQPRYSLRVRNNSFKDVTALAEGIEETHRQGNRMETTEGQPLDRAPGSGYRVRILYSDALPDDLTHAFLTRVDHS